MKIGIIGSRGFSNYNLVKKIIDEFRIENTVDVIVSGGAIGADSLGEQYAKELGIETLIFKPDYARFGKSAPFNRNDTIAEESDFIIAFWDGLSRGTLYTIQKAKSLDKTIIIIKEKE